MPNPTKEKGKTSNKQGKENSKKLEQADVADDDVEELDSMQIIDFDKLIGNLKYEKKMVEICIGRKGTKEQEVRLNPSIMHSALSSLSHTTPSLL